MKAFETKDDSLGIIELPKGQRIKVTVKDGRKVLEKVGLTKDEIESLVSLVPLGQKILNTIISIFQRIGQKLPCVLIINDDDGDGVEYIKTEQSVNGVALDKIFYQSEMEDYDDDQDLVTTTKRVYQIEAPTIEMARNKMRKALREDNWIK